MSSAGKYIPMKQRSSEGETRTYEPASGQSSRWTEAGDKVKDKARKSMECVKSNRTIIVIVTAVLLVVLGSAVLVQMNRRIGNLEMQQAADEKRMNSLNESLAELRIDVDSNSRQNEQVLVLLEAMNTSFYKELQKIKVEAANNISMAIGGLSHQLDTLNATFETALHELSTEASRNLSIAFANLFQMLEKLNGTLETRLTKVREEAGKKISEAVDSMSKRFTQHTKETTDLISGIQRQIDGIKKEASSDYDSMRKNVESIKADMTKGFSDHDTRIGKFESGLKTQANSVKKEHDNIRQTAENLQTQLTKGLRNHDTRLGKVESGLKTQKTNVADQLYDHNQQIERIQDTLYSHGNTADQHGRRISNLEGEVRMLQSSGNSFTVNAITVVLSVCLSMLVFNFCTCVMF